MGFLYTKHLLSAGALKNKLNMIPPLKKLTIWFFYIEIKVWV